MSVTRRGAGCGSLAVRQTRRAAEAQVQAASTPRPLRPEDGGGASVHRWTQEQTCNAPRAERRRIGWSVVTYARAESLTHPHEAAGWLESPAFRAPFSRAGNAKYVPTAYPAPQRTGAAKLVAPAYRLRCNRGASDVSMQRKRGHGSDRLASSPRSRRAAAESGQAESRDPTLHARPPAFPEPPSTASPPARWWSGLPAS